MARPGKVKTHRGYKICPPRGHKSFRIAARDQNCIVLAKEIRFPFGGHVEARARSVGNDLSLPQRRMESYQICRGY